MVLNHKTHNVFDGSSLGKGYSANAIQDHCKEVISQGEKKLE